MIPVLIPVLIPAAGASRRMRGPDKLMQPVADGQPLLAARVAAARATGQPVLVALPPKDVAPARWQSVKGAQVIEIAPWHGMSGSIAALVRALPDTAQAALILPADMPDITIDDMRAVLAGFAPDRVVRGASAQGAQDAQGKRGKRGKPGHPVLFPRSFFSRLSQLTGDDGARSLLQDADVRLVPLPGENALTDLDTPEDWARWRQGQAQGPAAGQT